MQFLFKKKTTFYYKKVQIWYTYLHECTLQWKNTLEIKEIFTSLRSKIYFTYEKEILKAKASKMSLT